MLFCTVPSQAELVLYMPFDGDTGTEVIDHSLCGIKYRGTGDHILDADFHVLVDGEPRFQERVATAAPPAVVPVHVVLGDEERFLTLACTEGTEMGSDWGLFGEPVLQLE